MCTLGRPSGRLSSAAMKTGKLRARLSCSCCIEPELSIMNTMSRSLFTDSSNVGAVGIGLPLGSGIAASSSVRPHALASAKRPPARDVSQML